MDTSSVVTIDTPSFLTDKLDLGSFLRQLKPAIKVAVELLIEQLKHADPKIAQNAAKALLEFNLSAKKEMNTDSMQRLIAEIKVARRVPMQQVGEDDSPRVDFTTIQEVG